MPDAKQIMYGMECCMHYMMENDIGPREFDRETVESIQTLAQVMMLKKLGMVSESEAFGDINGIWYAIENNLVELLGYSVITKYSLNDRIVTIIDFMDKYFSKYDHSRLEKLVAAEVDRDADTDPDPILYRIIGDFFNEEMQFVSGVS